MIVEKNKITETPVENDGETPLVDQTLDYSSEEYAYTANCMVEAYKAVKTIISQIPKDPNNPDGEKLFKTIKWDNGQLMRTKNNKWNQEAALAYPAVFVHYVDMYWNVGTSSVSEGRGTMRIRYVLNRLNNSDEAFECEGMEIYDRIVSAIESSKSNFPPLVSRFQLAYWDQPESHDDGLQQYWIDYQIWMNSYVAYRYKNYVNTYPVSPPFTNHSDQNETANPDNLPNQPVDDSEYIEVDDPGAGIESLTIGKDYYVS